MKAKKKAKKVATKKAAKKVKNSAPKKSYLETAPIKERTLYWKMP